VSAPVVALRGVHKWFGDLHVLDGVDLEAASGEVVALIGPSGSGKSTLLRCVNGLEAFDEGEAVVLGTRVPAGGGDGPAHEALWRPIRRRIGFVFQSFHLYPHRTALGNVTLAPVTVNRVERHAAEERARALLDRVGLADKADVLPRALSGGQRQRVAIARALAMDPEVLLFDEPTSALDPETIGEVLDVIRSLAAEHRRTLLIVTHELGFAREAADRVDFLEKGRILESGPPSQVLGEPTHARTREFLSRLL
jgi:ABC-type polar amino acid transport system ATPase subunit